jgi:aspartate/methionine/tyrosine aminotransferase
MPEFVQYAMLAAVGCKDYVADKAALIKKRRDIAVQALKKYLDADFYSPDGSMYIFPRLHTKSREAKFDSEKFALDLLQAEKVSVTPGTAFGSSFLDFIRITLLQDEERIDAGIEKMSKLL